MNADVTKQNYETGNEWHAQKSLGYMWTPQLERFLSIIRAVPAKILDVGCGGSGRDIQQFIRRGAIVEGLDYSRPAIEAMQRKFPNSTFYERDMTATKLPVESYDGIWACASICNMPKKEVPKVFKEFSRILKDGGTLFISAKEGEGERMVPDQAGERFFSFYSKDELKKLAEDAGFSVVHTEVMKDTFTPHKIAAELPRWISLYVRKS